MLKHYKFVKELGAGFYGTVDLYKNGDKKFVLKSEPLLDNEVRVHDDPKDPDRGNVDLLTYKFEPIFAFSRLVSMMPSDESKYFMRLIATEVDKSTHFNVKRLTPIDIKDENDRNVKIRKGDFKYCFCMLFTYAGTSLDVLLEWVYEQLNKPHVDKTIIRRNEQFINKTVNDLVKIVTITRKYRWMIGDFHAGNICYNRISSTDSGNLVLIDYDYMVNALYIPEDSLFEFEINADYFKIIRIMSGIDPYFKLTKAPFDVDHGKLDYEGHDYSADFIKVVITSKNYKQIKRYFIKFTLPVHALNLQECEKGKYDNISNIIFYIYVLFRVLDLDAWNAFWSANFPGHISIPLLMKRDKMIKLLDSYFR